MVFHRWKRPLSRVILSWVASSDWAAILPSVQMMRGHTNSICFSRCGKHASISSGRGSRFPGGRLFTHVFTHRAWPYFFEAAPGAWMASEFFTGGMMPTDELYLGLQSDLVVEDRWVVGGEHYAKTLRAWLERLDTHRSDVLRIFAGTHGADSARQLRKWRMFFIACEEAFAYRGGAEWRVSHFLWRARE